jgi:hypothetical protein
VTIPGLQEGRPGIDPTRIVVEAYPGILARRLIGRRPYKNDTRSKQTAARAQARQDLFQALSNGAAQSLYGLRISAPATLVQDPGGDALDALLCAIQAAWAWNRRDHGFGAPGDLDPQEGWIADAGLAPDPAPPPLTSGNPSVRPSV